jgi:hypothetical protein
MRQILGRDAAFIAVSAVIIVILGTQLVVGLVNPGRQAWPMLAYAMYKEARYDGERLDEYEVYAVLKDETKLLIDRDDLGMSWWLFRSNVVKPVLSGQVERLTATIDRYCDQSEGALARLEVSDAGLAISAQGLVTVLEPQVVAGVNVTCEER